jgi:hypothetical protein
LKTQLLSYWSFFLYHSYYIIRWCHIRYWNWYWHGLNFGGNETVLVAVIICEKWAGEMACCLWDCLLGHDNKLTHFDKGVGRCSLWCTVLSSYLYGWILIIIYNLTCFLQFGLLSTCALDPCLSIIIFFVFFKKICFVYCCHMLVYGSVFFVGFSFSLIWNMHIDYFFLWWTLYFSS